MRKHLLPLFLLVLALIAFTNIIPVHASTYVGFNASNAVGTTCISGGGDCIPVPFSINDADGRTFQSPFTGSLINVGVFLGTNGILPNKVVILTSAITPGLTHLTSNCNAYPAGACPWWFATAGSAYTVRDVESLSGLVNGFNTITLSNPVTTNVNQWIAVVFYASSVSPSGNNWLNWCESGCDTNLVVATEFDFGGQNPTLGASFNTATTDGGFSPIVGATFIPQSTTIGTISQCVGNCGNPAVTIVNTNSTHTINFNVSQTWLYESQSSINGFIVNMTENIGCSQNNPPCKFTIPSIGLYTTASSCIGSSPFTTQCPGNLLTTLTNNSGQFKGKNSQSFSYAIFTGQWIGIAFTATSSGLDINDTNTSVNVFNTPGSLPLTISSVAFQGTSKAGVYGWIVGNVINSGTPPSGGFGGPCGLLDCVLLGLIQSGCGIQTTQCLVGAGFFWMILLSGVVIGFVIWGEHKVRMPNVIPGEFFIFVPISFTFLFFEIGIFPFWVPIFMFIVLLLLFASMITGKIGGKGGLQV